jgi:branched-chain amino acid transport system permease protein
VLLTAFKSVVGSWTEHHLVVIGLLFMAVVIFLPKGLMGFVRSAVARILSQEPKP